MRRELIIARRDVNAAMIDFMEKHKIYWVPGGQVQKAKIVESVVYEVKNELLLEGGSGSGHFGHKGRTGLRGGSLPGGTVHGRQMVRSSQMAEWLKTEMAAQGRKFLPGEAVALLKNKFPGEPDDRYGRAVVKTGLVVAQKIEIPRVEVPASERLRVADFFKAHRILISGSGADKEKIYSTLARVPESHLKDSTLRVVAVMKSVKEVNNLYHLRSPRGDRSVKVDAFYDMNSGEMVVHPGVNESVILHEFGHSLRSLGLFMNAVWAKNASTGKVSRYGMTNKKEGFAEGYWMYVLQKERLRRKAPEIAAIYEKVFSK